VQRSEVEQRAVQEGQRAGARDYQETMTGLSLRPLLERAGRAWSCVGGLDAPGQGSNQFQKDLATRDKYADTSFTGVLPCH
jgi:hypothetical protein